jgi:hypothetical protein
MAAMNITLFFSSDCMQDQKIIVVRPLFYIGSIAGPEMIMSQMKK